MFKLTYELPTEKPLRDVIESEIDGFNWKRHKIDLIKKEDSILLKSKSTDIKAMKAGINSIISLLDIYEKVKELK